MQWHESTFFRWDSKRKGKAASIEFGQWRPLSSHGCINVLFRVILVQLLSMYLYILSSIIPKVRHLEYRMDQWNRKKSWGLLFSITVYQWSEPLAFLAYYMVPICIFSFRKLGRALQKQQQQVLFCFNHPSNITSADLIFTRWNNYVIAGLGRYIGGGGGTKIQKCWRTF